MNSALSGASSIKLCRLHNSSDLVFINHFNLWFIRCRPLYQLVRWNYHVILLLFLYFNNTVFKDFPYVTILRDYFKAAPPIWISDLYWFLISKRVQLGDPAATEQVAPLLCYIRIGIALRELHEMVFFWLVGWHAIVPNDCQVVAEEVRHETTRDKCKKDYHWYWRFGLDTIPKGIEERFWVVVHAVREISYHVDQNWPLHNDYGKQVDNKRSIIASTYACTQPLAMVIESMHAVSTEVAMKCTLRSEYLARVTELYPGHVATSGTQNQGMNSTSSILPPRLSYVLYCPCP